MIRGPCMWAFLLAVPVGAGTAADAPDTLGRVAEYVFVPPDNELHAIREVLEQFSAPALLIVGTHRRAGCQPDGGGERPDLLRSRGSPDLVALEGGYWEEAAFDQVLDALVEQGASYRWSAVDGVPVICMGPEDAEEWRDLHLGQVDSLDSWAEHFRDRLQEGHPGDEVRLRRSMPSRTIREALPSAELWRSPLSPEAGIDLGTEGDRLGSAWTAWVASRESAPLLELVVATCPGEEEGTIRTVYLSLVLWDPAITGSDTADLAETVRRLLGKVVSDPAVRGRFDAAVRELRRRSAREDSARLVAETILAGDLLGGLPPPSTEYETIDRQDVARTLFSLRNPAISEAVCAAIPRWIEGAGDGAAALPHLRSVTPAEGSWLATPATVALRARFAPSDRDQGSDTTREPSE